MNDCAFADAARQAPVRILRLPMLDYSIGHEMLLLSQRNALLFDGFECLKAGEQRAALMRAVLICYRTWNQNQRADRHLMLWGWSIRNVDWPTEIALFRNYRDAGSQGPRSPSQEAYEIAAGVQKEDEGRQMGGSTIARILDFACTRYQSLGFVTPYDMPLGFTCHLYLSGLEIAGQARIENQREMDERLAMEKHRADAEKEKACQP
jgi:hypothetical protein